MTERAGRVTGFFHAGLAVADIDRSLGFYRDALGLEVDSDTTRDREELEPVREIIGVDAETVRVLFLRVPGSETMVELFEYEGIEQSSAAGPPWNLAAAHICLFVDDLDPIYERLRAGGYETLRPPFAIRTGPHAGAKALYAVDPDGAHVELYQRPAEG